jgi:hypothetical protein
MKVFLDDVRIPPKDWVLVHWPDEAIALLQTGEVEEISLDHDLGDDTKGTGYDVLLWIEREAMINGFRVPKIHVHSANIPARIRMNQAVERIRSFAI